MGANGEAHGLRPVWGVFETLALLMLRISLTETFGHKRSFASHK